MRDNNNVKLIILFQTPSIDGNNALKIRDLFKLETGKDIFRLPVENRSDVEKANKLLDSYVPENERPNYQIITANYPTNYLEDGVEKTNFAMAKYDLDKFDYLVSVGIAGAQPASGNPTWSYKYSYYRSCPTCGNKPFCTDVPSDFKFKKLPKKQSLFKFYPPPLYFAREKFIAAYENSKLTGLSFEPMPEGLFLVKIEKHRWNDRIGVCDTCEMKTNVVDNGYFNLPEKYVYDIQQVETNSCAGSGGGLSPKCVMTPRAFRFFKLDSWACTIPIMPNYLSDLVWPAPRMFTNGAYPTTVYREK